MGESSPVSIPRSKFRFEVDLIPTGNPRIFSAPEAFVHLGAGMITITVFHNGRKLLQGVSDIDPDAEYVCEQSVPMGSYDQVRLVAFTPKPVFRLYANYIAE